MKSKDENVRDPARLWKLQDFQILDSDPEASFDDIVKIASALCGTPIALVSLVDSNRQWFKAKVGLDLPETPISQAVCANALGQGEILEIPDLTLDARTEANTLVTPEDGIRFYAGAPLQTDDGLVIGTLCVIDNEARPEGLTELQREGLLALGRQTMLLIEARKALIERDLAAVRYRRRTEVYRTRAERVEQARQNSERSQLRHRDAEEAGRIGTFEIEVGMDVIKVSAEFCRLFGLDVAESYPVDVVEDVVHPEDRDSRSSSETRLQGSAPPDVEYRIIRPSDGRIRWISRRASFDLDEVGNPIRMLGTVHDSTDRIIAIRRLNALLSLGDELHVAETVDEAAGAASETLGKGLHATRAGYASIDLVGKRVNVAQDWTAPNFDSVRGWRPAAEYAETLEKLREGLPLAISDVRQTGWLRKETFDYELVDAIAQIWVPLTVHGVLVGTLFVQNSEPRHWTAEEIEFAETVADRVYATIAKLQAEADQQILNEELGHRMKNMLAMIMALATQSLKDVSDQEPVENFRKRLLALTTAHEDLLRQNWFGARIRTIAEGVLSRIAPMDRMRINGPDITIGPRASLSLSLILHELGTNALKYGALANDSGSVSIEWTTHGDGEEETLTLCWVEKNGPAVTEPSRTGFGSRLIELGLLGTGDARVEFKTSGLTAEFTAPLHIAEQS